ncbi:MAG: helix-turn-helix transcriptional regulator [Chloroflexi bacterium]|nr:helix-turn-helix transcriptional regulator [Chloroflexota bacterium]
MTRRAVDACEVRYIEEVKVRQAQQQLLDGLTATNLANLFEALADPTRVRIVSALSAGELCVCDIAATLGMTQSAISHQLRLLRQLRLVRRRKAGQMVYYSLDDEHISTLFRQGMDHVLHG